MGKARVILLTQRHFPLSWTSDRCLILRQAHNFPILPGASRLFIFSDCVFAAVGGGAHEIFLRTTACAFLRLNREVHGVCTYRRSDVALRLLGPTTSSIRTTAGSVMCIDTSDGEKCNLTNLGKVASSRALPGASSSDYPHTLSATMPCTCNELSCLRR